MLEIKSFDDVRGNNVIIYMIRTLINKGTFPKFSIMSGNMGVGKSAVARLIGQELSKPSTNVTTFNFGMNVDIGEVEDIVFKMNPAQPRAFIFEELHGLDKGQQTALLTMLDKQPQNVFIVATTTEKFKILNTIRSRATVWDFKLLGNKQMSQLLDDYLASMDASIPQEAKTVLLNSAHGVPRDLLKSVDLAMSGDFTAEQLDELMGNVSEDLIFSLLCSLKSKSVDFASNIQILMDDSSQTKIGQLRDFFTRYLLERKGIEGATISKEKLTVLSQLYTSEELEKIGRTLVRVTPDTLLLELSLLNMELTHVGNKQIVGQQIDRVATHNAAGSSSDEGSHNALKMEAAKVSSRSVLDLKLE